MDKEYLSIKEFANLAGISRQAVYKQLNNQLTPYLKVIDGKKMLDKSGLELFDKQDNCKPVDNDFANQLVNQLTTELTEKGQQLKEKDKQISEKDKQIAEKDKQLAALQKLLDQEQHLHALTLQRVAELEDKHLNDLGMIDALDKGLMRVEYTIKDRRILQNAFGDDLVTSLTDQKINSLFRKYFNRDIVVPYQNWVCRNHEHLVNLTKKHRKLYQRWTSTFFRECRQYEELHGLPALFDIEDMESVFRELEKKSGRNSARKFAKFKDRAIFEADLLGNTARVKEIISKIEGMYL